MSVGPIAQYHQNSKYYSARPPRPNKQVDGNLPHVTIQMPVYKEGLEAVLCVPLVSNCLYSSSETVSFVLYPVPPQLHP